MIDGYRLLCVIPARGGSKGLPRKNTRNLCGRPLIAWTIDAAFGVGIFDGVIVSTDDDEIVDIARNFGAEVPFIRPAHLSDDIASSVDVLIHAIDFLAAVGRIFDIVVLLEPTSPLRESSDIINGLDLMLYSGAEAVVSVCKAESTHPAYMYKKTARERLVPYTNRQPTGLRRQDIEAVFFLDGTLYASRIDVLKKRRSFYHEDTVAYEVPKWKSIEIDDIVDFLMVETLARHKGLIK